MSEVTEFSLQRGETFDEFFAERFAPLSRLAFLLTGSSPVADELAQDACEQVFRRWSEIDHPRSLPAPLSSTVPGRGVAIARSSNAHRVTSPARPTSTVPLLDLGDSVGDLNVESEDTGTAAVTSTSFRISQAEPGANIRAATVLIDGVEVDCGS